MDRGWIEEIPEGIRNIVILEQSALFLLRFSFLPVSKGSLLVISRLGWINIKFYVKKRETVEESIKKKK